jgi:DNA repair protein RadA/Sms
MSKTVVRYVCSNCGAISLSWSGKCLQCEAWNTLIEENVQERSPTSGSKGRILSAADVSNSSKRDQKRLVSNLSDIDLVLGGGIVSGSVILIAGEPGIGKSTVLLQLAHAIAKHSSVLYISGEESEHQIAMRAKRLGTYADKLKLATSNSADDIAATIETKNYQLVIVDSIQTVETSASGSAAGSVSQITSSTQCILAAAKKSNVAVILVGHVTKEGSIAGPKILEHVVDVVLQLDGDRYGGLKVLRATKNRFGTTSEAGIFEMLEGGLKAVENPSAVLLEERQATDGSVVLATLEGTRPLLVEIQALVNKTSYGYPKRAASGIDLNRLNLLIAMLERRTKLNLSDQDIYINCVGGIRISEPAADLAICLAIGSAAKGLQLKNNAVVFGEVGLSGEIRHVPYLEKRIAEAKKLGFDAAIGPIPRGQSMKDPYLLGVKDVRDALNQFLKKE